MPNVSLTPQESLALVAAARAGGTRQNLSKTELHHCERAIRKLGISAGIIRTRKKRAKSQPPAKK
jgi:hypothetical protein